MHVLFFVSAACWSVCCAPNLLARSTTDSSEVCLCTSHRATRRPTPSPRIEMELRRYAAGCPSTLEHRRDPKWSCPQDVPGLGALYLCLRHAPRRSVVVQIAHEIASCESDSRRTSSPQVSHRSSKILRAAERVMLHCNPGCKADTPMPKNLSIPKKYHNPPKLK